MDINRIERRVKKIVAVLEAFKEDNRISAIEKDLLMGYVRELYDLIRESDADSFDVKSASSYTETTSHYTQNSVPVQAAPVNETPKPAETPVVKEQPKAEVVAPVQETIKTPEPAPAPRVEPVVVAEKEPTPAPQAVVIEPSVPKAKTVVYTEEIEAIFKMDEITDLSAKLSMSKIDDISKAIGINERIFTINELFGGNGELFNKMIDRLNSCDSFDQAKSILIHEVATPMQWEKEDKVRKAQQFVKHVRRKFN
ncbi:MAG: hypothetical protein IPH94_21905 [Saprospiraceae bacterium]|nr:hypothetical protein [Saprospiraceae bacterium]MBK8851256.1 hypothetical protein [Saprospiraceae bacterium]